MNGQPADVQRRTHNGERATDKGPVNKGRVRDRTTSKSTKKRRIPSEESYSRQPLLFGLGRPAHDEDRAIEDTEGALDLDREVDVACTGTGLTPETSAPGLGSPLPHLHWDWALRRHRNAWRTRVGVRWWRRKWGCDSARETADASPSQLHGGDGRPRCRCGRGEPSPGADASAGSPGVSMILML
jgi:hypothetical protein